MKKYIEAEKLKLKVNHEMDMQDTYLPAHFFDIVDDMSAADVIELNAFRNEVYQYISANKDEDANFLSGLETAVVIAEKMAGVYEEVEE